MYFDNVPADKQTDPHNEKYSACLFQGIPPMLFKFIKSANAIPKNKTDKVPFHAGFPFMMQMTVTI